MLHLFQAHTLNCQTVIRCFTEILLIQTVSWLAALKCPPAVWFSCQTEKPMFKLTERRLGKKLPRVFFLYKGDTLCQWVFFCCFYQWGWRCWHKTGGRHQKSTRICNRHTWGSSLAWIVFHTCRRTRQLKDITDNTGNYITFHSVFCDAPHLIWEEFQPGLFRGVFGNEQWPSNSGNSTRNQAAWI